MKNEFDIKKYSEEGNSLRERSVDYIQLTQNIFDSYPLDISHGLQKDAIQNGWDACIKKSPKFVSEEWKMEFELMEDTLLGTLLIISDFGTYGLTGKMTNNDISEHERLSKDERWARWESLAFQKEGADDLGARGQGKMILIGSSKQYLIFYDSLRCDDGTYRMGITRASHKGCPVVHFEEEDGRKKIREELGLEPINHTGTRIIIVDPIDDLKKIIKSGEFLSYIEETWWPIISKFSAKILIKHSGKVFKASIPSFFPIKNDLQETKNFKTWIKENINFKYNEQNHRIKHLAFACNMDQKTPELHQGIVVFRGGMKVQTIDFPNLSFRQKVYGYVELEKESDEELRKVENTNHYGFKNKGIWRILKKHIEEQADAFGNKKLGLGIDIREREKRKRNSAETKAMNMLRSITRDWPFQKTGTGLGGGKTDDPKSPPLIQDIGIKICNLKFPNLEDIPRLNYGQKLKGFYAEIYNKTGFDEKILFRAQLLSGDRELIEIDKKEILISSNGKEKTTEGYLLEASKKLFPDAGEYRLKFSITDKNKDEIHRIIRRFWVEMDPQLKGPFNVSGLHFGERSIDEKLEWHLENEGDNKYTLYYNYDHLSYLYNDENDERLGKYLSEIFCLAALQLLIKQTNYEDLSDSDRKKIPFDIDKILNKNPEISYKEFIRVIASIKYDIHKKS